MSKKFTCYTFEWFMSLGLTLTILGLMGCIAMTWLFPVCVWSLQALRAQLNSVFYFPRFRNATQASSGRIARHLAVLIPAHNEELKLGDTLGSVQAAIRALKNRFPFVKVQVVVALDGCSDKTKEVALRYGAEILEQPLVKGKWQSLKALVDFCPEAEWYSFVDSGALWPSELLIEALVCQKRSNVMAVAPAYTRPHQGFLESFSWRLERHFKTLESATGGPMSVHGATVLYRAQELRAALEMLKHEQWLNDDVVLPLTLRLLFPNQSIVYLSDLVVRDIGVAPARELNRRKRMVIGNLDWVQFLFPKLIFQAPIVALLSLRRIFRIFWAYWMTLLFGGLVIILLSPPLVELTTVLIVFGVLLAVAIGLLLSTYRFSFARLWDAAVASFSAPFIWRTPQTSGRVGWR